MLICASLYPSHRPPLTRARWTQKFAPPCRAAVPAPLCRGSNAPLQATATPAAARQAALRAAQDPATHTLLECKFLSKRSGFRCPCVPTLTTHKRGHLSVACSNGHQVPASIRFLILALILASLVIAQTCPRTPWGLEGSCSLVVLFLSSPGRALACHHALAWPIHARAPLRG
jgi:hypothetical protein